MTIFGPGARLVLRLVFLGVFRLADAAGFSATAEIDDVDHRAFHERHLTFPHECPRWHHVFARMRKITGSTCRQRCFLFEAIGRQKGWECGTCAEWAAQVYNIDLNLARVPPSYRKTFLDAAARWMSVIVGDVPDVDGTKYQNRSVCNVPKKIDDIHICCQVVPMDGPGAVIGVATAEFYRNNTGGPIYPTMGIMRFDSAAVGALVESSDFPSIVVSVSFLLS